MEVIYLITSQSITDKSRENLKHVGTPRYLEEDYVELYLRIYKNSMKPSDIVKLHKIINNNKIVIIDKIMLDILCKLSGSFYAIEYDDYLMLNYNTNKLIL